MRFYCEDLQKGITSQASMSIEEIDARLANFPKSKRQLCALIELIKLGNKVNVDDWECDMSEVVWPEVRSVERKRKNFKFDPIPHEKYRQAIDEAIQYAGASPEWNAMFELGLLKRGLKLVSERPLKHPLGNDYMAPVPVEGASYIYPYPSWIVKVV